MCMSGQGDTHGNSNIIAYYDVRTRLCVGEKFAELVMERVAIQEKNDAYMGLVERCFKLGNAKEREATKSKIAQEEKKKEILFTNDVEIAKEVSMGL